MDEVAACRRAARDAVRDIEPDRLQALMDGLLADGSMAPGVLTLRAARAAATADGTATLVVETDGDPAAGVEGNGTAAAVADHVGERAAGVQLIYEGLALIRELAGEDPWSIDGGDPDRTEENLAVLAADVLVSRGFYLLARTSAADKAVETVRNFGRDQTLARAAAADGDGADPDQDRNLEADVLQLALIAGAAGTPGVEPTSGALSTVADLAGDPDLTGVHVGLGSGASVDVDGESARTATDP